MSYKSMKQLMDWVQISYEEHIPPLPLETETRIRNKINLLLQKLHAQPQFVSLYFCSSEAIQSLNLSFRNKDTPTDILSWLYDDEFPCEDTESTPWGELVVCLDVCRKQAEDNGWSLETELLRLLVHGIAHLEGYDHELSETEEKNMLNFEQKLLSEIGLVGIYE